MSLSHARILSRLMRPLACHPRAAVNFYNGLCGRFGLGLAQPFEGLDALLVDALQRDAGLRRPKAEGSEFTGSRPPAAGGETWRATEPFRMTSNGTAIITVTGELVNRGAWVGADSGLTSYEGIGHQLDRVAANPKVQRAIVDIETPGGEAVGAFELADKLRKIAAIKPIHAVVNGMAASAGYALVSGATSITTGRTGVLGSIGVVMLHLDQEGALEQAGIKPTLIFAGEHKVDGNPLGPLPDGVRDDLQAEADAFYAQFLDTVSQGRGRVDGTKARKLTVKGARETQARTYIGADAVEIGLADAVGTFDEVLADIETRGRKSGGGKSNRSATKMDPEVQAQIDTARREGHTAGRTEGVTAGAAEERARLTAIVGHASLAGRELAALNLAMEAPGMNADGVVSLLDRMGVKPAANGQTPPAPGGEGGDRPDPNAARAELERRAKGTHVDRVAGNPSGHGPTGNASQTEAEDAAVAESRRKAVAATGRARPVA